MHVMLDYNNSNNSSQQLINFVVSAVYSRFIRTRKNTECDKTPAHAPVQYT